MEENIDKPKIVMYDVDDIRDIFHIGRCKAYGLMTSNGFPSMRLNKKLYVSKQNLESWISKQTGKTYLFNVNG